MPKPTILEIRNQLSEAYFREPNFEEYNIRQLLKHLKIKANILVYPYPKDEKPMIIISTFIPQNLARAYDHLECFAFSCQPYGVFYALDDVEDDDILSIAITKHILFNTERQIRTMNSELLAYEQELKEILDREANGQILEYYYDEECFEDELYDAEEEVQRRRSRIKKLERLIDICKKSLEGYYERRNSIT